MSAFFRRNAHYIVIYKIHCSKLSLELVGKYTIFPYSTKKEVEALIAKQNKVLNYIVCRTTYKVIIGEESLPYRHNCYGGICLLQRGQTAVWERVPFISNYEVGVP